MATRGMGPGDVFHDGKAIYLPPEITHRISLRAAEIVRNTAPRGVHNSRMKVRATWQKGTIGVYFPPDAMHLVYLDKGIKPFVMKNLEGKVIPIRTPGGGIAFRVAKNVGSRQILTRDEKGQIMSSKIRWRHPGVEPMNFVQPALNQAIKEWVMSLNSTEMISLMQNTQGPLGDFFKRFRKIPKVAGR